MSTRSATIIRQEQARWTVGEDGRYAADGWEVVEVARFYRHCDGYPEGHGLDMAYCFAGRGEAAKRRDWFQLLFGPLMTGEGLKGTPHEGWGAPTLEFEPIGTLHGDLEYLYAVTQRKDGSVVIDVWEIGLDEPYEDAMGREPLFEGTPEQFVAKFEEKR